MSGAKADTNSDGRADANPPPKRSPPAAPKSASRANAAAPPWQPRQLPALEFPPELPVCAVREEIAAAIRAHRVVIVSGETGSGKTTQLPKICAMAGRGLSGRIGHTQPRRIAATAVARRLADELGTPLGEHVGFKVRFSEQLDPGATFKIMTDGMLLAEIQTDPQLRSYDTLIIDEAHERSLNIDFLLGYVKQLLQGPRRDDLKIIITSATIDADRFAAHFGEPGRPAPVLQVSGRLFPVTILHEETDPEAGAQPGVVADDDEDDDDLPSRIERAIAGLWRKRGGDVLVFLPGEREIRDTADHLRRVQQRAGSDHSNPLARGDIDIVPLFARLSAADQQRVFSRSSGRRVVLATNVAETSLTVPGIAYVVDSGLARVKRYRLRGKVEQLQIEPISQAAANQRAGRCGRVSNGVCVRLYTEADFAARPRFTDPEVLRSSLAAVILRMKSLRLGAVEAFPFLDAPNSRAIADGYALLAELGAVDEARAITAVGRQLARLPLDPRMARMLLAAHEDGCLAEMLVIASYLAVQDPRERPMEAQQAADEAHRAFRDPSSDFLGVLLLWRYWRDAEATRSERNESRRDFTRRMEQMFVSPRRMREWTDVHAQLRQATGELGWQANGDLATPERVHRALLSGLLGNLGYRDPEQKLYQGTHQTRFALHPSSVLGKRAPRWVMCAEMVDTARLFGRMAAPVQPDWIERAASHLLARSWSDAIWSKKSAQAIVHERAVLYGLTLYVNRRVPLAVRDTALARDIFIRHALVEDDWLDGAQGHHLPFLEHNRRLIESIRQLEDRIRRPDLLVDAEFIFDWFQARLPAHVTTGRSLERWYAKAGQEEKQLLYLTREALLRKQADGVDSEDFPRTLVQRGLRFELDYRFDPGTTDDGVTMTVPLALLNQVDAVACEWVVPGLLRDKVAALARSLPQRIRRNLVPLPAWAAGFCERQADDPKGRGLIEALVNDIRETTRAPVTANDFRADTVAPHLFMNLRLVDAHGRVLEQSRHLAQLQARHGLQARNAFQQAFADAAARGEAVTETSTRSSAAPVASHALSASNPSSAATAPAGTGAPVSTGPSAAMPVKAPSRGGLANSDGPVSRASVQDCLGQRFTRWPVAELPAIVEAMAPDSGATIIGYPALVDRSDAVSMEIFDDERTARERHRLGVRRLLLIACRAPLKGLHRQSAEQQKRLVAYVRIGTDESLRRDLDAAVIDRASMSDTLPVTRDGYEALLAQVQSRVGLIGQETARRLDAILDAYGEVVRKRQSMRIGPSEAWLRPLLDDIDRQLALLVYDGFIADTPAEQFAHLTRYLQGIVMRLTRIRADPVREARHTAELAAFWQRYNRLRRDRQNLADPDLDGLRWLLEELRIAMFAQSLRTPSPVSGKRVAKVLERLGG